MDKKHEFSEGDAVRITNGAFACFVGTVIRVNKEDERLMLAARLETEPDSDPHTINVGFSVVEKIERTRNSD